MPGTRDNRELAFVTIDTEILGWLVVRVQSANRDYLHTRADDCITVEGFLQPELHQRHFAAALYLALVLATFFFFNLDSTLRAAVLELYLRAYAPAFAEVITQIDDHVRQVELAEMVIGVFLGVLAVTQVVIAVPAMLGGHFSVSTDSKPSASGLGFLSTDL